MTLHNLLTSFIKGPSKICFKLVSLHTRFTKQLYLSSTDYVFTHLLFNFGDIIGHSIKLFLTGYGPNSATNVSSGPGLYTIQLPDLTTKVNIISMIFNKNIRVHDLSFSRLAIVLQLLTRTLQIVTSTNLIGDGLEKQRRKY